MSFHELTNGYPWLTKRTARVLDRTRRCRGATRSPGVLALFVPYAGRAAAASAA